MRLDIYREILLKINTELNIDGEYSLDSHELMKKFNINTTEELKEVYSKLYSRKTFYSFEKETTLEEPFLMKIDLDRKIIFFYLNPVWKRRLFFKGRPISQSLTEIWEKLNRGDSTVSSNLFSDEDTPLFNLKKKLKTIAAQIGGHNQMVVIGLIERSKDMDELEELASRYKLSEASDSTGEETASDELSLEEYKNLLRNKINSYPSYKRMSLLGYINRTDSKEKLAAIFNEEGVDEELIRKVEGSFHEKREISKKTLPISSDIDEELEAFKSEVRLKVMKMSTFNKMTILGFVSRATSKEEISGLIEKYQIK